MFLIRSLGGIGLPGDNPFIIPSSGRIPFSTPHSAYVASIALTMCQIKKRVMNYLVPEHFDRTHINGIRNLIEYSDALDQLNKCVLPVDDYNLHATLSDIINKLKPGFIIMRTQNQIQHKLRTINQSLLHKTILSSMPKPTRHHANDDKYYLSKNSLFVVTSFLSGRSSHHFFGHQKQFRLRGGFGLNFTDLQFQFCVQTRAGIPSLSRTGI